MFSIKIISENRKLWSKFQASVSQIKTSTCLSGLQKVDWLQIRIVAVDLQPMSPLPGVVQLQGDITEVTFLVTFFSFSCNA